MVTIKLAHQLGSSQQPTTTGSAALDDYERQMKRKRSFSQSPQRCSVGFTNPQLRHRYAEGPGQDDEADQVGNHALQDYQMQLMLLKQRDQEQTRLMGARQEQDYNMALRPFISAPLSQPPKISTATTFNLDDVLGSTAIERLRSSANRERSSFPGFPYLPMKIRIEIWNILINTPRLVHLTTDKHGRLYSTAPVPVVLHINHESRTQALKSYILWGNTETTWLRSPSTQELIPGIFRGRTYLNCEIDIVSFGRDLENAYAVYVQARKPKLSDAHAKMIRRVAEEGDSAFWLAGEPVPWEGEVPDYEEIRKYAYPGVCNIYQSFPGIREFFISAPGLELADKVWLRIGVQD